MKKERVIRVLVLTAVFFVAILFFSYITNRGNTDMTADMGNPTLPSLSFTVEGQRTNLLSGYVKEMDIPSIRDTVTPLQADGNLQLNLKVYQNKVSTLDYEVQSLDGTKKLGDEQGIKVEEKLSLNVGKHMEENSEAVLKVKVLIEKEKPVYYYTRIVKQEELRIEECLTFVKQMHKDALEKKEQAIFEELLETIEIPGEEDLRHVTIHSAVKSVKWGEMKPEVKGDVRWFLQETAPESSSILLRYQVETTENGKKELYNVNEFFRVKSSQEKMILLDYDRTMKQLVSDTHNFSEKGITLGMTDLETPYIANAAGTMVSFVQERELWNYNKEDDEFSLVFSFAKAEGADTRNLFDQHEVRLVQMDHNGNTTFIVIGYMNRGEHEGEVGVGVYYYNREKSYVEKKAFIPSIKSKSILADTVGELAYYNNETNDLHIMMGTALYKVNLDTNEKEIIIEGLTKGQYMASEDGSLFAFQTDGGLTEAGEIEVMNFQTKKTYNISAKEGESVRPLGFVDHDFVYGTANKADGGSTVVGETVLPMYKVEIADDKGEVVKNYQMSDIFILDAVTDETMITLRRATKAVTIYTGIEDDFISNNQVAEENNITVQTFTDEVKGSVVRIVFEDGIKDKSPKILKPKQILSDRVKTIELEELETPARFYLYSKGALSQLYDSAGEAIQKASAVEGTVVTSDQKYVWRPEPKDSRYENESIQPFSKGEGETTLAACLKEILRYEEAVADIEVGEENLSAINIIAENMKGSTPLNLSGCTVEQLFPIINQGTPVIAMLEADHAVLLMGYSSERVAYMDPSSGMKKLMRVKDMDEMVASDGNIFIGYVK